MISAEEARQIAEPLGLDLEGLMHHLLETAKERAVVPISGFRVGAVAAGPPIGDWANLYLGANVEFEQLPVTFSIHAEQAAVNEAWISGETALQSLACTSPPCGLCRQFLTELGHDIWVVTPDSRHRLSTLLPHSFGPADLGKTGGLMTPHHQPLVLLDRSDDPVVLAALDSAARSYTPYTGSFAGCAVETRQGEIFTGRYAENAAYNPSLSALQSALARVGRRRLRRIVLVILAGLADPTSTSQLLAAAHSPVASLEIKYALPAFE